MSPKSLLAGLLQVLEGTAPLVILPHDNPDPDALASAAALKFLVQELVGKEAVIAQGGIVGRAENRAMLTYLKIDLEPVDAVVFTDDTLVALVDTQPGRMNNSLPPGRIPTVVIDHHPAYDRYEGVPFLDLRENYGSTSTILTEYVRESRLEVESKIATALFYGIMAETQDLGRESTPADIAAAQFLYPYANKRRLGKIENARVPREYFAVFHEAIERAQIYGNVVVSVLPELQYPDMVAEVADFLLRLDEVEWACAIGRYKDHLHVSLRTTEREANAGEILQRVLGSRWAGGHDMIAGGRKRIAEAGAGAVARAADQVQAQLLAALAVKASAGRPLV
ncbi:MAG: bifunctional oligoribonuclease/PAP phosphatase NrnA [Myxococcales bacterium]|nr:bifunctional oligoribonuclease/PAP phosphatase NrnA [Myxococcales bacterium]